MTNMGGIGSSGVDIDTKIYRIRGYDYNGCDGWSDWLTDSVYLTKQAEEKDCIEFNKNAYARYRVVETVAKR